MDAERHPILVVDDDADLRASLVETFSDSGYLDVVAVESCERALEILQEGLAPCLIVLDLMMPGMSGWELLARIQSEDLLSQYPVLIITAAHAVRRIEAGEIDVLRKPFAVEQVLAYVSRFC